MKESISVRCGISPYGLLVREAPKAHKTMQALSRLMTAHHHLMIRPCCWRHRTHWLSGIEINLEAAWKLPPRWLAFMVPKGTLQAAMGEKDNSDESLMLWYQPVRNDVPSAAIMAWLLVRKPTAFWLDLDRLQRRRFVPGIVTLIKSP